MSVSSMGRSIAASMMCVASLVCTPITTVHAVTEAPDNAALLYYQAFLHCPDYSSIPREASVVNDQTGYSDTVIDFVEESDHQHAIQLACLASRIRKCDWGMVPTERGRNSEGAVFQSLRSLRKLVVAESRVLVARGDYSAALARCLMLHQLARHFHDGLLGTETYAEAIRTEADALRCIHHILNTMLPDERTLGLLRDQLGAEQAASGPASARIKQDLEQCLSRIPVRLREHRVEIAEDSPSEEIRKKALNLTDEELVRFIRTVNTELVEPAIDVLASGLSYEQTYTKLDQLAKNNQEKGTQPRPEIQMLASSIVDMAPFTYTMSVKHRASFNAIRTAIEIYLLKAKTGQLPDAIPSGLPKDPYSGQDFEYEQIKDGFVLRCRVKDLCDVQTQKASLWGSEVRPLQYEFKVKKGS